MENTHSRYTEVERYSVPGPDGRPVTVGASPRRDQPPRLGRHVRRDGERLDHLAAHYLDDPAGYWRICDANNTMVPEALTDAHDVDIPAVRP